MKRSIIARRRIGRSARALTLGRGVDILVDVAGSAETEAEASAVADGGIIAAVGLLTGEASWGKEVGKPVARIVVGNREGHEAMLAFCAARHIRPVVDAVFDLSRLGDALRLLESASAFGKIAINLL